MSTKIGVAPPLDAEEWIEKKILFESTGEIVQPHRVEPSDGGKYSREKDAATTRGVLCEG